MSLGKCKWKQQSTLYTYYNGENPKCWLANSGEDMKRELSFIASVNAKWYSQFGSFLQN